LAKLKRTKLVPIFGSHGRVTGLYTDIGW